LLTEKGIQLVEGVSMKDIGWCVHERSVLCEWRSALYVRRVMRLGDEALNRVHAELEVALKRAEKGGFTSTEYLPNWSSRAYKLLGVT